ncbi:hypothetical protein F0L68_11280 [Solihabitans fulvus]|uniref:Uncharacterized protein n=1 Tax=Solihabitans fulvus TaxID=1892852 RepID=A0A5B2XHZ6_9PSEU|nr:hypothetical protein [Solihabitans fulvus]KAA2262814.1 hypothetical protein F0L68_11280 [Solihabitans fulvus]
MDTHTLEQVCADCAGTGTVPHSKDHTRQWAERTLAEPPWSGQLGELRSRWERGVGVTAGSSFEQYADLMGKSDRRFRFVARLYAQAYTGPPCATCQGLGRTPTEAGNELLQFLRQWGTRN